MRIQMTSDGRVLEGTAKQIVTMMQSLAFGQEDKSLTEYITWAVAAAARMTEVEMEVTGDDEDALAASLVEEMLSTGLAELAE